jgi:hypothetical protein
MSLREVLKRWNARTVGAAVDGDGVADGCRTTPSLLEELAADPADFADLARVLRLDLRAVIETLTADRTATPAELVSSLESRAEDEARLTRVRNICAEVADRLAVGAEHSTQHEGSGEQPEPSESSATSWGGRKEGGWGRWTRARGGARVHRSATERTPAGAAS